MMDTFGAVEELFRQHWSELIERLAWEFGRRHLQDAEDAVADVFVSLLRSGRLPDEPRIYLRAAARRRYFEIRRKATLLRPMPPVLDPSWTIANERLGPGLRVRLRRLPPRLRRVAILRLQGLGYREIAGMMGIRVPCAKVYFARLRRKIAS